MDGGEQKENISENSSRKLLLCGICFLYSLGLWKSRSKPSKQGTSVAQK
jgi:hypothetical protein